MDTPQSLLANKLLQIRPGAQWSLLGSTYDKLVWLDETQTKPTPEELGL